MNNPREPLGELAALLAEIKASGSALLTADSTLPSERELAGRVIWLAGRAERLRAEAIRRLAGYYPLEVRGQRVDGTTYRAIW